MKFKSSILVLFLFSGLILSYAQPADDLQEQEKSGTKVLLETDRGDMLILLYDETPLHRDNFIKLAREGFYVGTLFHRVIHQFMIQAGDPDSRGAKPDAILGGGGPGYTIEAEIKPGLIHKKGAVAAARQGDHVNPEKRSSGSQFYIVQGRVYSQSELDAIEQRLERSLTNEQRRSYSTIGGTPHLDNEYTVFGEVIEGLEIIDNIAEVETNQRDRPLEDIRIKRIRVIE